ncbi:MAG: ATP-binding protein, partial [Fidelibacterota bacterium]
LVELDNHTSEVRIVTDPELLRLALEQVLDNAVEALPEQVDGAIRLELRSQGEEAILTVSNRGPGLADSDGSEWWVPFYTTKSGHLGLGLVRVRRIVEALGGRAEIRSKEDAGVAFDLALPL